MLCPKCGRVVDLPYYQQLKLEKHRHMFATLNCPQHPTIEPVEDCVAGDVVCPECGLGIGDRVVDVGAEWRTFENSEQDASRVGAAENPFFQGRGLGTSIAVESQRYPSSANSVYHRRMSAKINSDRALAEGFELIKDMADRLHAPQSIMDTANRYFSLAYGQEALRGKSIDAITAACMHFAGRQEDVVWDLKHVKAVSGAGDKEINRTCLKLLQSNLIGPSSEQALRKEQDHSRKRQREEKHEPKPLSRHDVKHEARHQVKRRRTDDVKETETSRVVAELCHVLQLSAHLRPLVTDMTNRVIKMGLIRSDYPLVATCPVLYMVSQASKDKRSANEICKASGVAESTIVRYYERIVRKATALFPSDFEFNTPIKHLPRH